MSILEVGLIGIVGFFMHRVVSLQRDGIFSPYSPPLPRSPLPNDMLFSTRR